MSAQGSCHGHTTRRRAADYYATSSWSLRIRAVLLWLVCGHGTARLRYADIHQPDSSIAAPAQPTVAGSCSVRSIPRVQGPLAHYGVLCRL